MENGKEGKKRMTKRKESGRIGVRMKRKKRGKQKC